ncbi:achaete-scute homolog 5-like [Alosa pseudoharengus]|nr:achaete-scute homolog 5-like [Alosa sapidissima]XP_041942248.1 achaete-scute homolog 5-like [Alosa sapidissima]XP_048124505.1 achaete-scute homolog 5-like [Alosa alosa]XP_048124506.1 achaete-scute homolog 5-like [Alosa alosa]
MAFSRDVLERLSYSRTGGFVDPQTHPFIDALGLQFHLEPTYLEPVCGQHYGAHLSYLPLNAHISVYDYSFEPAFIRKRNERERQRVRCVNEGYARLRQHLPYELEDKRLSKVETLRAAISYIKHLQEVLSAGLPRAAEARGSVSSPEVTAWSRDRTS